MARFNVANPSRTRGVITSSPVATTKTFEGAPGFTRDPKAELFLLAVTNFVSEDTFYEQAKRRDSRFQKLVGTVTSQDPRWMLQFLTWLRVGANMRTAALVAGIEAARTLAANRAANPGYAGEAQKQDLPTPRSYVDAVLQRPDEPGEALAYWWANHGRKLPSWFTRALGDAVARLYTPWSFGKWDSDRRDVRFADVIELSQLKRAKGDNSGLYKYILDDRHKRGDLSNLPDGPARTMLVSRWRFGQIPADKRRALLGSPQFAPLLKEAGLTWEAVAGWLQGPMDAQAWEAVIPTMGYTALLRNLRNFDSAGIGKDARSAVAAKLTNPQAVEKSRTLPMQFLTAYNNVRSDFWRAALDEAATLALASVPSLPGRTLILVDTSSSMHDRFSRNRFQRSAPDAEVLYRWDVAALFGIALGKAAEQADVVSFSDARSNFAYGRSIQAVSGCLPFDLRKGENLLAAVARFRKTHFIGGGTDTMAAVTRSYRQHDRVVVLTDEQASAHGYDHVYASIPPKVPVYTFNLAGYEAGHAPSAGKLYTVGGLTDAGFRMIMALEQADHGRWPWEVTSADQRR